MLSPSLIKLLACPDCQGKIKMISQRKNKKSVEALQCLKCKRVFAIQNGIPVMLPSKRLAGRDRPWPA